ncbi:hypothetical protein [uncultured Robinsoniella sp.]
MQMAGMNFQTSFPYG